MESNDRLNLQNDKEIEKMIPFEQGILFHKFKFNRTYPVLRQDLQNQQMEHKARKKFSSDSEVGVLVQKEMYNILVLSMNSIEEKDDD